MSSAGLCTAFDDAAIVGMVRTPWVDLGGALSAVSPIDLGIKAGRAVLARAGIAPQAVDSVLAGSMAQASFDAYFLPRHVGLYCGVPQAVPALAVQRICGTGLELLRQAGEQLRSGAQHVLCVGASRCRATRWRPTNIETVFGWVRRSASRTSSGKRCTTPLPGWI